MSENNTAEIMLVVPDPEHDFNVPIYTGHPAKVGEVLIDGTYKAIVEDWTNDRQYDAEVTVTGSSVKLTVTFTRGE